MAKGVKNVLNDLSKSTPGAGDNLMTLELHALLGSGQFATF